MNEKAQILENILGIKLSVKEYGELYDPNQKNAYSIRKDEIETLYLDDLEIDDISKLIPYLAKLRTIHLNNCVLPNFTQLLALKSAYLYFDNVRFKTNDIYIRKSFPVVIRFSNMNFDASCFECFQKSSSIGVRYLEFKNCHIENIEEINNIKNLYQLAFDNITYTYKETNTSLESAMLISISNTKIKDVSFIPFKKSLKTIQFENCEIENISGLTEFPKLKTIEIDSDTSVSDKEIIPNPSKKEIKVNFTKGKKTLDLNSILCFKNFIQLVEFEKFEKITVDSIGEFNKIKTLSFSDSIFNVEVFISIASQIENIHLRNTIIENYHCFSKFNNLLFLKFSFFDENGNRDLKTILPLKKQLKSLEIFDGNPIHNFDLIREFTVLESLNITSYPEDSVQAINSILTLHNLKQLHLSISDFSDDEEEEEEEENDNNEIQTFNLGHLKNLEFLVLESDFNFIGFEFLKELKSLKIGDNGFEEILNINSFPKMENLKRLNITNYDYKIEGLEQFPNLEFLRLKGVPKLALGNLDKLKVLDLTNSSVENFSEIASLPNLERLEMSSVPNKIDLSGISKFPNLKWLTFLESYEVDDISELKYLKKLEYLDLYLTTVSDVRVLNGLPNLKEVNLYVSNSVELDLEKQIEKSEIILNCGLPAVLFTVWEEDEFGI